MSDNATGEFYNGRSFLSDGFGAAGNISVQKNYNGSNGFYALGWDSSAGRYNSKVFINVSHIHTYYGGVETRPQNYTIRIWKRIA